VLEKEILIMDEPTASLSQQNTEELFRIIHQLKTKGVSIIYISHRLQELSQIGDRVTVLRDGRRVGTFRLGEVALPELIQMMVGRKLTDQPVAKSKVVTGRPLLEVNELAWLPKIKGVSFSVRKGEIVGFAGLVGAGRTDLMRLIFGAESSDSGKVTLDGRTLTLRTPADAVRNGIGMLTEDRKGQGLVMGMSIRQNISLANLARFVRLGRISKTLEKEAASREVKALRIATPSIEHLVGQLSGGNQQKVVLAKWLTTSCRVLIFDEPTRGIDVGAKAEIYVIMRDLAAKGMAIIMVSSDLPEILRVSDRVIVMAGGRITGELPRGEATQERIMGLMLGGAGDVA
jgi:ribose transport system ATP-binding protein